MCTTLRRCSLRALRRLLNRSDDVWIGRAAAQIAAHVFTDLVSGPGVPLAHTSDRSHDLTRSAITALECIMVDECLLHWVQGAARLRQPFYGRNFMTLRHQRKTHAGQHPRTIHMDGTRATLTVSATLLGPRQANVIA